MKCRETIVIEELLGVAVSCNTDVVCIPCDHHCTGEENCLYEVRGILDEDKGFLPIYIPAGKESLTYESFHTLLDKAREETLGEALGRWERFKKLKDHIDVAIGLWGISIKVGYDKGIIPKPILRHLIDAFESIQETTPPIFMINDVKIGRTIDGDVEERLNLLKSLGACCMLLFLNTRYECRNYFKVVKPVYVPGGVEKCPGDCVS